ncbi:hypothetical protein HCJ46_10320 [Listeria booriae]|uniref:hypothetical protein n=1 Tax=Listeria booriae TaxID=1552123 RepID=UPI00162A5AED|nr:hypothetical protein [Listeria booriae]MBC1292240.1 hypothetical protein [Listeria booriae]MBC1502417.1 hypothetical protein [Listeria booriae]MBC1919156.1 hypothetical protein [Listeria booriae]
MTQIMQKMKNAILYITRPQREKRQYARYEKERCRFEKMTDRELSACYVNTKASYEHMKNFFTFVVVAILLAVVMGVWKKFSLFIMESVRLLYSNAPHSEESTKIVMIVGAMVFAFIAVSALLLIALFLRGLHLIQRKLLVIEEERNERNKN